MKYVISTVKTAPVRKEPNHRSEMTSQLLKDEAAEVLEEGMDTPGASPTVLLAV